MIKAITTKYNGYRFRSRLEARWAIFFDMAEIGWEYEPEGFTIGKDNYLIDFKIQSIESKPVDLYVEIKPKKPTEEEIRKCFNLALESGIDVIMICGSPGLVEFNKLVDDWSIKTGYTIINFPSRYNLGDQIKEIEFDTWCQTNRFSSFQTDPTGKSIDVWPLYLIHKQVNSEIPLFDIVSRIHDNVFSNLYSLTTYGQLINSTYISSEPKGRFTDHPRLMYAYEISRSVRFEFDEYNLHIPTEFYLALDRIPINDKYRDKTNSWSLYYNKKKKTFKAEKPNISVGGNLTLIEKRCPSELIKTFTKIYKNRDSNISKVKEVWKGFLFRYSLRSEDEYLVRRPNYK
jgi:hypothetical protein